MICDWCGDEYESTKRVAQLCKECDAAFKHFKAVTRKVNWDISKPSNAAHSEALDLWIASWFPADCTEERLCNAMVESGYSISLTDIAARFGVSRGWAKKVMIEAGIYAKVEAGRHWQEQFSVDLDRAMMKHGITDGWGCRIRVYHDSQIKYSGQQIALRGNHRRQYSRRFTAGGY